MLTGEIRSQIDQIWNAFWTGGISNPLEVIEQITYLLFLRRLDDLETLEERKATSPKASTDSNALTTNSASSASSTSKLARCTPSSPKTSSHFCGPWAATIPLMDARFTIPTPQLLAKVVDLLGKVPMEGRDTKGVNANRNTATSALVTNCRSNRYTE